MSGFAPGDEKLVVKLREIGFAEGDEVELLATRLAGRRTALLPPQPHDDRAAQVARRRWSQVEFAE